MYETQVKRTIFVGKCPKCGEQKETTEKFRKEWFCMKDHVWVPFEEVSYTGPELK